MEWMNWRNGFWTHTPISIKELLGTGKNQITFDRVPSMRRPDMRPKMPMSRCACGCLKPRLAAEGVTGVYESTERPLVQVITDMEREGVLVDRAVLSRLSGEFAQKMAAMEDEIFDAGR